MAGTGAFIVLEGPDGAGKTTQARRLMAELGRRGLDPLLVREPGQTPIGEKIRAILLDPANEAMDARTELFLFMASRTQLCLDLIRPALAAGRIVLADRFLASSAVYQGLAGGVGLDLVLEIGGVATGGVRADLTIVLDIDAEAAVERVARSRVRDRVEQKDLAYHRKVCSGYREYVRAARARGEAVEVVTAAGGEDEVAADVLRAAGPVIDRALAGGAAA